MTHIQDILQDLQKSCDLRIGSESFGVGLSESYITSYLAQVKDKLTNSSEQVKKEILSEFRQCLINLFTSTKVHDYLTESFNFHFKFEHIVVLVELRNQRLYMLAYWTTQKEFDGWFMLGPTLYDRPIDYCHLIFTNQNEVRMPYFDLTDLLLNTKIGKVAFHLVKTGWKFSINYQNISSPPIDLDIIRQKLKIPQQIKRHDECPICYEKNPNILMVTDYSHCHTVCKECWKKVNKCPITGNNILYFLNRSH